SIYGVHDDLVLASSIKEAGNVFLPVFLSRRQDESEASNPEILKPYSWELEGEKSEIVYQMNSVTLPIQELISGLQGVGNVRFSPDEDAIYRRMPLLFSCNDVIIPALSLEVSNFVCENTIQLRKDGYIWKGQRKIPLDDSGQMIINYHGPQRSYPTYSVASIINSWAQINEGKKPQIPPSQFEGKIVFIGTSAPGLFDLRSTPLSSVSPGVEIQAVVVDNILNNDFISIPRKSITWVLILIFALLTGIGVSFLNKPWIIGLFFILCLALPAVMAGLCFLSGYWLEWIAPEMAVLTSFISAALLNYSIEGKQRRFIKNVFRYYLSPSLIEMIVRDPELLKLGGEKREITSLFTDIKGFTSISENLSPDELVNLLNLYLSEMSDIILSYKGTLDKYEGDAIIAFWNAPLEQKDHALLACRAALDCQNRLDEMRSSFDSQYGCRLHMRIGINTGPCVVGNMGSRRRFDYTAIGDSVNLASRLEGACKQYRVAILIGQETHSRIRDFFLTREVDIIRVVGKGRPVKVFEIIAEKDSATESQRNLVSEFQSALKKYRNREWKQARNMFESIKQDELSGLYAQRCVEFQKNSPPLNWDGVFDLREK
ncbi:MAG: CHASE2 domain-containing protein, partial [Candidatus Aminicenantes bacterium]|nr:CHASE2 domain-containing protein [Candidatus Aminicenantes bacterium]